VNRWAPVANPYGTSPRAPTLKSFAGQLAHDEGRQWDSGDIDQDQEHGRVADNSLRAEYLNRARELLRDEKI
jgi:hypothetical protein